MIDTQRSEVFCTHAHGISMCMVLVFSTLLMKLIYVIDTCMHLRVRHVHMHRRVGSRGVCVATHFRCTLLNARHTSSRYSSITPQHKHATSRKRTAPNTNRQRNPEEPHQTQKGKEADKRATTNTSGQKSRQTNDHKHKRAIQTTNEPPQTQACKCRHSTTQKK